MKATSRTILILASLLIAPCLAAQDEKPKPDGAPAARARAAPDEAERQRQRQACEDGVRFDDGAFDRGYGFVPSAKWGIYAQRFNSSLFPNREIKRVCVCLQSRSRGDLDFEVVFYKDENGRPAATPFESRPGRALAVPLKTDPDAGKFYATRTPGVTVPEGPFYIGIWWNPSEDRDFFICADHSPETPRTPGFQREDRAKSWDDLLNTRDSAFAPHQALMIRATAASPAPQPRKDNASATPTLENGG
ncbi:MAG: hypothetical protein AAF725_04815 [Acidobacteriota bacterium]